MIPSSSLAEVWSAQTWTLGTLFTHIIVTCKPPCRKHKIHLYVLNLQAMTAQREQGEKDRRRKIKEKSRRCEAGPCSQRQKSRDSLLPDSFRLLWGSMVYNKDSARSPYLSFWLQRGRFLSFAFWMSQGGTEGQRSGVGLHRGGHEKQQ